MRLSERRATNIGLLYSKVRNNIGGDIHVDVPPTKILGGCVPGIPGGVDASGERAKITVTPLLRALVSELQLGPVLSSCAVDSPLRCHVMLPLGRRRRRGA